MALNQVAMNVFNKSIRWVHKITGLVIALFFIMWFVTGIVLLYHTYPRVRAEDRYRHMAALDPNELPDIYSIPGLADSIAPKMLSVEKANGKTQWTISGLEPDMGKSDDLKEGGEDVFVLSADTLFVSPRPLTSAMRGSIARVWAPDGNIVKVDTLRERQQWVMYERYEKSLPILRYYFDDPEKSQIFVAHDSGEVLQATTRSQRLWSWMGAIPHKLYIPLLRKDVKRWENVLLVGGLFCLVAALSGFYMGIYYLVLNCRKNHHGVSPFKKRIWRYHHVSGLVFGVFLIAWGISGSLAMQRVPKWMVRYDGDYFISSSRLWGRKPLPLSEYRLDYRELFRKYKDVKSVTWDHFGEIPVYVVVDGDREIYIDASSNGIVTPLSIPEKVVATAVERYFGDETKYNISLQRDYDEYYLSRKGDLGLPVWRVDVDNADGSRLYVDPKTGYVKYLNKNRMVKKWLFGATHYLGIKFFVEHQGLRYVCLWILCAGCVVVCVTGIGLYISRKRILRKEK